MTTEVKDQVVPSPDNPLYSVGQVADMFGVKETTVRTWIRSNRLTAHKIQGRWKVQKSELVRVANEEFGE
jgi:excisionase family DNA binding protein